MALHYKAFVSLLVTGVLLLFESCSTNKSELHEEDDNNSPMVMSRDIIQQNSDKQAPGFQDLVRTFLSSYSEQYEVITNDAGDYNDWIIDNEFPGYWDSLVWLKSRDFVVNRYDQKTYQRFPMGFHAYATKEECDSAFEARMACMGMECNKVIWGEPQGFKMTPAVHIQTPNTIIYAHNSCELSNAHWAKLIDDFKEQFGAPGTRIMISKCGGTFGFEEL